MQVDPPGKWYETEVRRALKGLQVPVAVTSSDELDWMDFSYRPWLGVSASPPPPILEDLSPPVSQEALSCLQALGRMVKGSEFEIASLAGLPASAVQPILPDLQQQKLVVYKSSKRILRKKSKPAQMDLFPSWHLTRPGLSLALRSWGVPPNLPFPSRLERNLYQIGTEHRQIARSWPAWLKSAWPQAEIWVGWSEVRIPGLSVIPDALAWGRIQGCETLFWLEVGDEHKTREQIIDDVGKRLRQAIQLAERTGVRLVFAILSPAWVHEAARWGCGNLLKEVAVVMGNPRRFGELPMVEWSKTSGT